MVDRMAGRRRSPASSWSTHAELRNPLTTSGLLERSDGVLPPDRPHSFDEGGGRTADAARELARRLEGADDERHSEDLDLGALVRSAVDLASPSFARRSISVTLAVADGVVVHARADELAQVISNLLQNAVRYTPADGTVRVSLAREAGDAVVRVTNSGAEIPADDLPRVWERFFGSSGRGTGRPGRRDRAGDREATRGGGGGRVGATSEHGTTTFWLSLPA